MLECDEIKDEEGPSNTLEHFTELEQILNMIDSIQGTDAAGFEKEFEQYTEVLTRYVCMFLFIGAVRCGTLH